MSHQHHIFQYYGITVTKHVSQALVLWLALWVLQCQAGDVDGSISSKPPSWVSNLHSFAAGGTCHAWRERERETEAKQSKV